MDQVVTTESAQASTPPNKSKQAPALPTEILIKIFKILHTTDDTTSAVCFGLTCRAAYAVLKDKDFWPGPINLSCNSYWSDTCKKTVVWWDDWGFPVYQVEDNDIILQFMDCCRYIRPLWPLLSNWFGPKYRAPSAKAWALRRFLNREVYGDEDSEEERRLDERYSDYVKLARSLGEYGEYNDWVHLLPFPLNMGNEWYIEAMDVVKNTERGEFEEHLREIQIRADSNDGESSSDTRYMSHLALLERPVLRDLKNTYLWTSHRENYLMEVISDGIQLLGL